MRRILRKIAEGEADKLGDTSTLADPSIVEVSHHEHSLNHKENVNNAARIFPGYTKASERKKRTSLLWGVEKNKVQGRFESCLLFLRWILAPASIFERLRVDSAGHLLANQVGV